jgi:hypothetical protein
MELSSFSENIVTVPYERGGETVELSINIDAFTPKFFREAGKRLQREVQQEKKKGKGKEEKLQPFETEARLLEKNCEVYADMLCPDVLKGWTVEENGIPIAPTKEVLMRLPPRLLVELWEICQEAARTVKKTAGQETGEMSESTHGGSMALRVVGQNT